MKLQVQDYVAAERIQRELCLRLPKDPVIQEFSKYLPSEALAQKHAANDYGDEYYDDEEGDEKEEDEKEEDEEQDKAEEPVTQEQPDEIATQVDAGKAGAENENSEYEDENDDGYGEEDYDAEGRYKWGNEGADWDWYYREDKEAYERGDMVMPNTLNPPIMVDDAMIQEVTEAKARVESASTSASSKLGVYRT